MACKRFKLQKSKRSGGFEITELLTINQHYIAPFAGGAKQLFLQMMIQLQSPFAHSLFLSIRHKEHKVFLLRSLYLV